MPRITSKIFKKQEISGKVEAGEISEETAEILGNCMAEFLLLNHYARTVVVSAALTQEAKPNLKGLLRGLQENGVEVIDIGACPTSALYFVLNILKTASFGIKIISEEGNKKICTIKLLTKQGKIKEKELQEIFAISEAFSELRKTEKAGSFSELDGRGLYSKGLIALGKTIVETKKIVNLKIIFDLRQVTEGLLIKEIMQEILGSTGGKYLMTSEGDSESATIKTRNWLELQKAILKERADFGITYDQAAEELIVLDRMGEHLQGNTLLLLAAAEILKTKPGAGIVGATEHLTNYSRTLTALGGKAIIIPAEDTYVEAALENNNGSVGEGQAGHFFFADKYYGYLDPIYATIRFLKIFSDLEKAKQINKRGLEK